MSDTPTTCSCRTIALRVITWVLLLVCVGAWMTNALSSTPDMAALTNTIGLVSGGLFLMFFAGQLMG